MKAAPARKFEVSRKPKIIQSGTHLLLNLRKLHSANTNQRVQVETLLTP